MNRRLAMIENRKVLADSGESVVNIGLRDIITAIQIEFRATNGATSNIANTLAECVSAVELIDGGQTLVSLTGMQAAALTAYNRGYIPYWLITEVPGNTQNAFFELQFGRWHGDTVYALDPAKFSNPQIRVKWNLATIRAIGATSYVTGSLTLTITADIMVGAPNPQGMLTAKQHYSFTTAASGTEYIDLPVDRRLKGLMFRSYSASGAGLYGVSNLKLSCDNDKFVPFDLRKTDFQRFMSTKNPPFTYKHLFYASNGDTIYSMLKLDEAYGITPNSGDTTLTVTNNGIGNAVIGLTTGGSAATNDQMLQANVMGFAPYGALYMDLGEYDDPGSWLDMTEFRSAKVELAQDVASSAASVVLVQELVY